MEIVDLACGQRTALIENAAQAQFLPSDYIIAWGKNDTIIAARSDLATQRLIGEPVTVWHGKLGGSFRVSPTGALAMMVQPADITGRTHAWIDELGRLVSTDPGAFGADLWICDFARRASTRLPTSRMPVDHIWSNDGQRIACSLFAEDEFALRERRADGSGESREVLAPLKGRVFILTNWSPDGKTLAVTQWDLSNIKGDVLVLERDAASGTWIARPHLNSPADEGGLSISPDGKWVRFQSGESGRSELCVQRFPGTGAGVSLSLVASELDLNFSQSRSTTGCRKQGS